MSKLKSGIRRIKCQILRQEEYKLGELVGKTVIEGHKALVTVPGIKMCLRCLDLGHVKNDCQAGDRCRICRGFGHVAKECSTANKIMAATNAEKEQLSAELQTIDDSENKTNDEQSHANEPVKESTTSVPTNQDNPNPFAPTQNVPLPPPPPPQSYTTTNNERLKRNNGVISPDNSPTTNDATSKMRAIEEESGENNDEHEATDEEVTNDDEKGYEDLEIENNESASKSPNSQNSPTHDDLTISSIRNEIAIEKIARKLSQKQKKTIIKITKCKNSNPIVF